MSYTVKVNGNPVTVVAGSLTFDQTIGKRAQASFTVFTDTNTHFEQYEAVLIYDQNNNLAFSGYITSPKEQKPGFQNALLHTITCTDQHYLADKRVVAATYTNKTCGYIVQDIMVNVLSNEGVATATGQIYDGVTPSPFLYPSPTLYPGGNVGLIPSAIFAYCTVSQAFDALTKAASAAGVPYYWMLDQYKSLWFVPYTTVVNGTTVDGTQIDQVNNPCTVTRANPTYRNTQYIVGGVAQTVQQTETRKGDGNTQAWTMGYNLNSTPTITVNGTSKTAGIKGTSGSQFYWAKGDPTVTQDSGQTKLVSTDTLQVVYIGEYPSVIIDQNAAQVAYQSNIDGTSGIFEHVDTDNTLTSTANGLDEASQLLTLYAQQGLTLQFTTLTSGFAPGQMITVNLPAHNLYNTQLLISEVSASDQTDGYNIWYQVTAVLGPFDVTWVHFFSKVLAQQQIPDSINVGVSQSAALAAFFTASLTPTAVLNTTVYACPIPSSTLFPAATLFPC